MGDAPNKPPVLRLFLGEREVIRDPPPPPKREPKRLQMSTDQLMALFLSEMKETHADVLSVGHNTVMLNDFIHEVGQVLDTHSEALNYIITALDDLRRRDDDTRGNR